MQSQCEICGSNENITWAGRYSSHRLLCQHHAEQAFQARPIEELFDQYFRPECDMSEKLALSFISKLKVIAKKYRDHGREAGDATCELFGISI